MKISQVARIIAVWMIIVVSVVHTYDDFANLTTRGDWVTSMTECFAKMGAIGKWSRQVEIGAITEEFDMQKIGNDLLAADQGRDPETKAQTVAHRIDKTKEGYKATLGGYLDTLFGIFKIGNFLGHNNRLGAVRAYLLEFYQFVPYHNICHGITVGLYSASIYAVKVNVKITEAFSAFYGNNQDNDYANVFVNNVPNNEENRLMVKEALPIMQRLFMAGLFHDIGHSGFSNSSLGPTKAARNTNFLTILARPPVAQNFAQQQWHCVANLADITATNAPRLKAFISNLLTANDNNALDEADALNGAQEKLAGQHAVYGPRIAAIMQTIAQYGRVDQYKQVKAFCPSAEMIHALGAFNALHGKVAQADLESIVQAILNTNVLPHMRFGPGSPAYPLNIPITERIVHVADVMGLVANNDAFRYEMLKQVIFEFFIERKVNPGSLAFMFPTQERLAQAQNEVGVKAAYVGAFIQSQVNFAKSIVRDVRSADLELNPYFIDGEANFGRMLNLFSEPVSYFENNPNYADVMFEAQDWADFYNNNNWPRSYFRLI